MCLICQARDPSVTSYDSHLSGSTSTGVSSVSAALPSYSLDQIGAQLTHGYWQSNGSDWRKFNVSTGGTLTYDISGLDATGKATALQAFAAWTAATGIQFTAATLGSASIVFQNWDSGAYAYSYIAGHTITQSYVNVNTGWQAYGGYYLQTFIHEIGHAMGLGHAGNYNGAADFVPDAHYQQDSWQYSIMSYFAQWENTYTNASSNYVATAMMGDMVAMQWLYGTATNVNTGNTVYGDGTNLSQTGMDLNNSWAVTIFDSAGTDTINLASRAQSQRLDLRGGQFSDINGEVGNLAIMRGALIENAVTGNGNDTITGNEGDNAITSGAGNDLLVGSDGADTLDGGAGSDTVQLAGNFADHGFDMTGGIRVTHSGGSAVLLGIETLQFADGIAVAGSSADGSTFAFTATGAGYVSRVVTLDTGSAGNWASFTDTYDAEGTLLARVTLRDDGSSVTEDFTNTGSVVALTDDDNLYDWTTYTRTYDAGGQLVSSVMLMDNGVELATAYSGGVQTTLTATDTANINAWASYVDTYDGTGQRVSQSMTWDDGRVMDTVFSGGMRQTITMTDAANGYAWSSYTDTFNASGQRTAQSMTMDNGLVIDTLFGNGQRTSTTLTDTADVFVWQTSTTTFGAGGAVTRASLLLDDGRRITTDFDSGHRTQTAVEDTADRFGWDSYVDHFDFDGHRTQQVLTLDTGMEIDTHYYATGMRSSVTVTDGGEDFFWSSYTTTYDTAGHALQRTLVLDSGQEIVTHYAEPDYGLA